MGCTPRAPLGRPPRQQPGHSKPSDDRALAGGSCGRGRVLAGHLCLVERGRTAIGGLDGELARISGKSSRAGHLYDLASDALVTVLVFVALGIGVGAHLPLPLPPAALGCVAGCAIALIFYLRMQIEQRLGKAGTLQASLGGFETEDVLYLIPLATLCDRTASLLIAAAAIAPLYLAWVVFEYRRVMHRSQAATTSTSCG